MTKAFKLIFKELLFFFRHLAKGFIIGLSICGAVAVLIFSGYIYLKTIIAPNARDFLQAPLPQSSNIFARDGTLLYEIYGPAKRTPVKLEGISPYLQQATVAVEDKTFFEHKGIALSSLLRSAIYDYYLKDASFGGSTITQQLVKNSVLSSKKTFSRKIAEILWAMELERSFSKTQILEKYLNLISYGRLAFGAEAASQTYFGKNAKNLSLAQSAYLAALPQAPSLYNPLGPNRKNLDERKNFILKLMLEQNRINRQEYNSAVLEEARFQPAKETFLAPYFTIWIRQQLFEKFGQQKIETGGFKIYTTLDLNLQKMAEELVSEGAQKNINSFSAHNAALVAIDPKTGEILAMVGGKDYFANNEPAGCVEGKNCMFEGQVNLATALRQPGSSFKPYVYLTAFSPQQKYFPSSPILDSLTNFGAPGTTPYVPHNYNGRQYGRVTMRKALAGSLNISAVRTAALVGEENVIATTRALGVTSPMVGCGLSLALGSCEMSLLEHTAGFAGIANGGIFNPPTGILNIEDSSGNSVPRDSAASRRAADPQAVFELISIMTDDKSRQYIFGKKNPLTLPDRIVGAKTGTTQNWKDGWTLGFTPSLAAGVWTGNNNGALMLPGSDGVFTAAPIWQKFMQNALNNKATEEFSIPEGIQKLPYNTATGKPLPNSTKKNPTDFFADFIVKADKPKLAAPAIPKTTADDFDAQEKLRLAEAGIPDTVLKQLQQDVETIPTNNPAYAIIASPTNNSDILKLPFFIAIKIGNKQNLDRLNLLLDDKFYASEEGPLFIFKINSLPNNGAHKFVIRAVSNEGSFLDSAPLTLNIYLPENSLK